MPANEEKENAAKSTKHRLVVTFDSANENSMDSALSALKSEGFDCLEKLESIQCALGLFSGDWEKLKSVDGVKAIELEGSMETQD